MYRTEHFGHTMVFPGFSSMKFLHELWGDFIKSCDDVNRAMTDGKALDQLQDRLAGPFSVNDVKVNESVHQFGGLDVNVLVPNGIAAEEKL